MPSSVLEEQRATRIRIAAIITLDRDLHVEESRMIHLGFYAVSGEKTGTDPDSVFVLSWLNILVHSEKILWIPLVLEFREALVILPVSRFDTGFLAPTQRVHVHATG